MNRIIVSNKQFRKMPYNDTTTKWTKTKGDIEGILYDLREKGILKKHAWMTEGSAKDSIETLYMELELPISEAQIRQIRLKFQPVMIFTEKWVGSVKKGNKRLKLEIKRDTSWRMFWWHFKSKMEAVQYGLVTLDEEFLANILLPSLPDQEVTFGEAFKQILEERKMEKMLEDMRLEPAKKVDAEHD